MTSINKCCKCGGDTISSELKTCNACFDNANSFTYYLIVSAIIIFAGAFINNIVVNKNTNNCINKVTEINQMRFEQHQQGIPTYNRDQLFLSENSDTVDLIYTNNGMMFVCK